MSRAARARTARLCRAGAGEVEPADFLVAVVDPEPGALPEDRLQRERRAQMRVHLVLETLWIQDPDRLDVGAEIIWGERELVNGTDGDFTRFQFSAKYAF